MAVKCMGRAFVILFYTSCLFFVPLHAPLVTRPDNFLRGQPEKEQTTEKERKETGAVKSSEQVPFQDQSEPDLVKAEQELQNATRRRYIRKEVRESERIQNETRSTRSSSKKKRKFDSDASTSEHESSNAKWRSSNESRILLSKNHVQIEAPQDDDELIKELKDLHLQKDPPKELGSQHRETAQRMSDRNKEVESQETSSKSVQVKKTSSMEDSSQKETGIKESSNTEKLHSMKRGNSDYHNEEYKEILKANLAKEMAELQELGGTKDEIMRLFPSDASKFNGFLDPHLKLHHDKNINPNFNHLERSKVQENQHHSRFNSLVSKDKLMSDGKPTHWRPTAQPHFYQAVSEFRSNVTANLHINIPTKHPVGPHYMQMRQPHTNHPITIKDAIQNLQRGNPQDIMRSYSFERANQFNDSPFHKEFPTFPGRNTLSAHQNRFQNQKPHFPVYYSRHGHGSHLSPHWHHKNTSIHSTDLLPSSETKPLPYPDSNLQLSQEMKRELHDGKIIVLSDSLVRSNFANKSEKKEKTQNGQPTAMAPLTRDQMKTSDLH